MKIAILADGIPPEGKGGAERIAWQSALLLAGAGHEVAVITTTRASTSKTSRTVVEGVQVFAISTNYHGRWRAWVSLWNPRVVREVKRILKEVQPEIVHAHNVHQYLSYASLAAARAPGARVFMTAHDAMSFSYDKLSEFLDPANPICAETYTYKISTWKQFREQRLRYNPFRNFFIRHILKKLDGVFAVSKALADALTQNGIQNVQVLYNGIDTHEWEVLPQKVTAFKRTHDLEGKSVMLFGGRVTGTKGGDALLAALPAIRNKAQDAILLIMGTETDYVRSLRTKAESLNVSSSIRCTGWISGDELRAAYHAADIIVVPSVYLDPLPTVVLEAMACAKPVVGSCLGGIPEMVEDGVTGYVVHPLDTAKFAEKCSALLLDHSLARTFGEAGLVRVKERFSPARHLESLLHSYQ